MQFLTILYENNKLRLNRLAIFIAPWSFKTPILLHFEGVDVNVEIIWPTLCVCFLSQHVNLLLRMYDDDDSL